MIRHFLGYDFVRLPAYNLDFGSFIALTKGLVWTPVPGNIVAKILAGNFALALHRHFTFRPSAEGHWTEAGRYGLLLALNVQLSSAAICGFALLQPVVWAKIAGDDVCVAVTFALGRAKVFRIREIAGQRGGKA
jgi:putative flippase GtrA